jgi:4-diphosphocytidyl-2-C-methyl-D-erythritol kinase
MTIDSPMALGWGRGERLLPLPALAARPVVLVMPTFLVATKDAYGWLAHDRGAYDARGAVLQPTELDTWEGIEAIAVNEFEPVVSRRHPAITEYVDAMRDAGGVLAMMSGSGSAVFGVFADAASARAGAETISRLFTTSNVRVVEAWTAQRVERVER